MSKAFVGGKVIKNTEKYLLETTNKSINLVGNNSIEKKDIYTFLEAKYNNHFLFVGTNSFVSEKVFFEPIVRFLINYLNFNYTKDNNLEKKLKDTFHISSRKVKDIIKFLKFTVDIGNYKLDFNKSYRANQIYKNQYDLLKNTLINYLEKSKNKILIFDNYDYFDKWSKKIVRDLINYNFSNNIKIIVSSTTKIKNIEFDTIKLLNPEKLKSEKINMNFALKIFLCLGDSISKVFIEKIYEEMNIKNSMYSDYDKMLKKNDFIYKYRNMYFVLNKEIPKKLFKKLSKSDEKSICGIILRALEKLPAKGLYDYYLKISIYKNLNNYNKEKNYIYKLIPYFEKLKAYEDLLKISKRAFELEKNINKKENLLINNILKYFKKSDKFKDGYRFINKIDKKNFTSKAKNKINFYKLYYKRQFGNGLEILKKMEQNAESAKKNNWLDLYVQWMGEIVFIYYINDKLEKAKKYLSELTKIKNKIDKKLLISNYYNLKAFISKKELRYNDTLKYYQKSINLARKTNLYHKEIILLSNLSIAYYELREYNQAIKKLNKAMKKAKDLDFKRGISFVGINLCLIYLEMFKLDLALKISNESLKIAKQVNKQRFVVFNYFILAKRYFLLGDFKNATIYFSSVKNLSKDISNNELLSYSYIYFGLIFYYRGKIDNALNNLEIGYKLAKKNNNFELFKAVPVLVNLLYKKNRTEKAIKILNSSMKLAKKIGREDYYILKTEKIKLFEEKKESKILKIKNLIPELKDNYFRSDLYYELWKLTGENAYKQEAINIYRKNRRKYFLHDRKINEMNQG
ncbi:MAG: hypothetical protein FXF47_04125 [Candidatus Mcinerneyibacterium aminivorans]|uniref:Uncharacterized protein n=1 Tax=Candidatus Mcinerneyibacterium aminivorans TaxID=2703815 RepID=A0A5D0MIS0_9BACT|nr:MAG: hypothetical protein FXF47_04125 [Candidatus Mcinerneyibacterium aminivorans]